MYVFYTGSNTNLDENNHALLSCVPTEAMQSILEFAAFLEFGRAYHSLHMRTRQYLMTMSDIVFSALRVFVIMGRSYTFAIVVLVLSLIPIGTSMVRDAIMLQLEYEIKVLCTT